MLCTWARFARNNFCAEQLDGPVEKTMNAISRTARRSLVVAALGAAVLVSWYPFSAQAEDVKVMLSGGQEVPPVTLIGLRERHDLDR